MLMNSNPRTPAGCFFRFTLAVSTLLSAAFAQEMFDRPQILPRTNSFERSSKPVVRTNVDLVLVPVTVLDHADKPVNGLRADNFTILDNQQAQTIKYFSSEDVPISLTVILDASGSMAARMDDARQAVIELFNGSNPQDDLRMITFGDQVRALGNFSDSLDDVHRTVASIQADGFTALWDAMYLGLAELQGAAQSRKAIVLISDGGDNHSRYTQPEIKSLLQESDVQVYAIGMFDRNARTFEERMGPLRLDEVTRATGGRLFSVHDRSDLQRALNHISLELRNQYLLGYCPSSRERDGKWRHIKVKVNPSDGHAKLHLYAKKGYYGPTE
jgi:Ca-activated chloride channel homolog